MPFTHTLKDKENKATHKIQLQPTFHVPTKFHDSLQTDETFPWRDRCFFTAPPPPRVRSFSHSEETDM